MPTTPVYAWPYLSLSSDPLTYPAVSGETALLAIEATMAALAARVAILESGPNSVGYAATSAGETTSSTSYADLSGASLSITKRAAATSLKIELAASFVTSSTGRGVDFAVRIAGTDYLVAPLHQALPAASARLHTSGHLMVTGIAAGATTVQVRWKAVAGSGTISRIISDDRVSLHVTEVTG